jgi:hypothetical protein
MKKKLSAILFSSLVGSIFSSVAAASATFSDSTFNLSDYAISKYQSSGADVTVSQTSSGNPGTALQIEVGIPRTFLSEIYATQYLINTTFRYDPGVLGAIASVDASADVRGEVFQNGTSRPFSPVGGSGGGGLVLLRQDGHLYTNLLGVVGPPVVGSRDFSFSQASGLKAVDFGLVTDLTTFAVDKSQHPDFSTGILEFGVPGTLHATNLFGLPETNAVVTFDNLNFTVSSVPELETYAMLLAGLGLVGFMARHARRHKCLPSRV